MYRLESRKGIAVGLKLLRSKVRHLGTEINLNLLKSIYEEMKPNVDYRFATKVTDVVVENKVVKGVMVGEEFIEADYVLLGVGRNGSEWLCSALRKHKVKFANNRVDIGVRVETNDIIMVNSEL